ncbi:hypothetical protein KCU59_g173, partial [Aureobasidium melanogenum]
LDDWTTESPSIVRGMESICPMAYSRRSSSKFWSDRSDVVLYDERHFVESLALVKSRDFVQRRCEKLLTVAQVLSCGHAGRLGIIAVQCRHPCLAWLVRGRAQLAFLQAMPDDRSNFDDCGLGSGSHLMIEAAELQHLSSSAISACGRMPADVEATMEIRDATRRTKRTTNMELKPRGRSVLACYSIYQLKTGHPISTTVGDHVGIPA